MSWYKKAGLGAAAFICLGLLWVKVRAAQGRPVGLPAASPAFEAVQAQGMISGAAGGAAFDGSPVAAAKGADADSMPETLPIRRPAGGVAQKIVRNANVSVEVASQEKARAQALAAALKLGAQVAQDDSFETEGRKSGTLAFRVPPGKLDDLVRALEPIGRVLHRSVSMQNLTEEYVDLQSRLANMRKVERRLTDLLAFKTSKLADVLQVERQLERVGADIERLLGRMKYIDALAAESTVTVSLTEPSREASAAPGALGRIADSIMRAWNTFITTGLTLLDLTGFLIAVGLWTLPIAGLAWSAWRRLAIKRQD